MHKCRVNYSFLFRNLIWKWLIGEQIEMPALCRIQQ